MSSGDALEFNLRRRPVNTTVCRKNLLGQSLIAEATKASGEVSEAIMQAWSRKQGMGSEKQGFWERGAGFKIKIYKYMIFLKIKILMAGFQNLYFW